MKLCFVCGEYPPAVHGGIGSMVQTLARALVNDGHTVRVVGLNAGVSERQTQFDNGVEVWRLPLPGGKLGWINSRRQLFAQVAAFVQQGQADLVEVPDWQGWAAHWPALPVPVVTRLNGSATYFAAEMGRRAHWLTVRLEGRSLRRSDFWCSVSKYTAGRTKALFQLPKGPDAILPNPVTQTAPMAWAARRSGMVVFSGTLTEKKGVVQLIDQWPGIESRFPEASLHLLGKDGAAPGGGSMIAHLRSRLAASGCARVYFYGHVPREQVVHTLADARVAVFPSFAEAFAIAPLEAMAAGVPTIASALGSGPELIDSGVDGLTVDPREPGSIGSAIATMLGDEAAARRMGEAGRCKVADHYSIDCLLPVNLQFYRACVAAHAARKRTGPRTPAAVFQGDGISEAVLGSRDER